MYILVVGLIFSFLLRSIYSNEKPDWEKIQQNCNEIFQDQEKCKTLVERSKEKNVVQKIEEKLVQKEEYFDFKTDLQKKTKIYVKEKIGEPDHRTKTSSRTEIFVYKGLTQLSPEIRSKYNTLRIYFTNDRVSKIRFSVE